MNFSPYQPPPDSPAEDRTAQPSSYKGKGKSPAKPWFTRIDHDISLRYGNSYQGGAASSDPASSSQALTNDPEASVYGYGNNEQEGRVNAWESRFGWRIDVMAAAAYLGGPITALLFLILETQNDYVRFHAYQSALLTTPLVLFMILTNLLIPLPAFLRTLIILTGVGVTLFASYRAWKDAQEGLSRYWLPYIGERAERWVNEE